MKILIVSDTHKSHRNLERILKEVHSVDLLIHLGDTEGGEDDIAALADCPSHIVRGNNDFFSELPQEEEFEVMGHHIFITHELTSVTYFCDQVLFLYQGTGVEHIAVSRIREAKHPYAVQLLSSVIELEINHENKEKEI